MEKPPEEPESLGRWILAGTLLGVAVAVIFAAALGLGTCPSPCPAISRLFGEACVQSCGYPFLTFLVNLGTLVLITVPAGLSLGWLGYATKEPDPEGNPLEDHASGRNL